MIASYGEYVWKKFLDAREKAKVDQNNIKSETIVIEDRRERNRKRRKNCKEEKGETLLRD